MNDLSATPRFIPAASPSLAIALGGGGARGLAHIVVLEALDELGLRPAVIAGTSIGAVLGAAYASGLTARLLREIVVATFRARSKVAAKLLQARVGRFSDLLFGNGGNPVQLDAERCLEAFWPGGVPKTFADLLIPTLIVAADFHACKEVVFEAGPLSRAIASSIAIPGIFQSVECSGHILIDGGAVNPLPYDLLMERADIVMAVDVTIGGRMRNRRMPRSFDALLGAAQIMQGSITAQKLKRRPPDILVRPPVDRFAILDFMKCGHILRAADAMKDDVKRQIAAQVVARQSV
jgi:NTE family protein